MTKNIAVLISGNGSNLKSLVLDSDIEKYGYEISLVVSSNPMAKGLHVANELELDIEVLQANSPFALSGPAHHDLSDFLLRNKISFICLAGYMRILSPTFCEFWKNRCINIHPSLLPKYPGLNTHKRVIEAGETTSGCTVHYVSEKVDAGEIIRQAEVAVYKEDTVESLSKRVLEQERNIYPSALAECIEKLAGL